MDTQKSKHVSGPAASCIQPGATNLAIYGCGKPAAQLSSTNSSTVNSMTSTAGSDEEHPSATHHRSPFSSDSSELDQCIPLISAKSVSHASDDTHRPNTAMAATANTSGTSRSKSARKESHQEEAQLGASTMSPCDHCKIAQQKQRTCSFYSEPVSWRQDSSSAKGGERQSSPKMDTAHVRKETSIAVQRNSANANQPNKEDRSGRVVKPAAAPTRKAHAHGSSSDRLPLHRILNDPRVYYVLAFAGLAALMVVSGTGIALATHRRRRRRQRRGLIRGLATAKDMVTALLTTWVTYSRWFRRLVFK